MTMSPPIKQVPPICLESGHTIPNPSIVAFVCRLEHEILVLQDQLQLAAKGSHIPQEILQRLNTAETACAQLEVEKVGNPLPVKQKHSIVCTGSATNTSQRYFLAIS